MVSPELSRLFALLRVQLSPSWDLGTESRGTGQFLVQAETGRVLSQTASGFVCPGGSRWVNRSRRVGFTSALRCVRAPGDWLSVLGTIYLFFPSQSTPSYFLPDDPGICQVDKKIN